MRSPGLRPGLLSSAPSALDECLTSTSDFQATSRLRDHQRVRFQLSPIKNARALRAAFFRLGNTLLTFSERDCQTDAAALLHFRFLHLRHAFRREVEPLARVQYSVL